MASPRSASQNLALIEEIEHFLRTLARRDEIQAVRIGGVDDFGNELLHLSGLAGIPGFKLLIQLLGDRGHLL